MAKLTIPPGELLFGGHSACPGCGPALAMRYVLKALGPETILSIPASCWTVIGTPYPTTALDLPVIDTPIEATGASLSGLRAGAEALGFRGLTVLGFAGDGGTADIGLQSLSGMLERGTDAIYVMYDNEAYMNTGVQRSGSTPANAWTTTTPVLGRSRGKVESKKDIMGIVAAHHPPYAATANIAFPEDLVRKVTKAKSISGPRFFHVLAPCPPGWRFPSEKTIEIGRLATDTNLFPLYEVEQDRYRLTRTIARRKPIGEYLRLQGRFDHLTAAEVDAMQRSIDARYERLQGLERLTA